MSFSSRTEMLLGSGGVAKLAGSRVAVFGIGGVGGYVCEALARAGVGGLDLFDDDAVAESNLNRQLTALHSTLCQPKAEVMAARIGDINPACRVRTHCVFYTPEVAGDYPLDIYDYVVDAVDTVAAKLELIWRSKAAGVPVLSVMGAGNKLRPELFRVADIEQTRICPLARVMRRELRRLGIRDVKVVYSEEEPLVPLAPPADPEEGAVCEMPGDFGPGGKESGFAAEMLGRRPGTPKANPPGSISFVPGAAGLVAAGAVVRDLLELR